MQLAWGYANIFPPHLAISSPSVYFSFAASGRRVDMSAAEGVPGDLGTRRLELRDWASAATYEWDDLLA